MVFGIAETGERLARDPDGPLLIGAAGHALPDAAELCGAPVAGALADLAATTGGGYE
ncbi:hypothetical protein ACWD3I_25120 [Streptomyces sp. NPDC002817]|uniref:hypothetical protein n=1 Tax=Streptomyces sp. NPDC088357 TaxID=3154655 RepID=UPI00341808F0